MNCECAKWLKLCHIVTPGAREFKLWNESGTNREGIADSPSLLIRSPQHLGLEPRSGTR